jgi:hypothetical protein
MVREGGTETGWMWKRANGKMGKQMEKTLPSFFIFLYPLSVHPSVLWR